MIRDNGICTFAVMWALHQSLELKTELSVKLIDLRPHLHPWSRAKRMGSWIQVAQMSFLHSVAMLSLSCSIYFLYMPAFVVMNTVF